MSATIDPSSRENLSPKAFAVVKELEAYRAAGQWLSDAVDNVKEQAFSADDHVYAIADGLGYLRALMIDDEAISMYSLEELEDAISDAMVEASGRGLAAGETLEKEHQKAYAAGG